MPMYVKDISFPNVLFLLIMNAFCCALLVNISLYSCDIFFEFTI